MKLKAFTMLEILMITLIVGIGLLSIVVAISKAKVITNNTKQHIIATQLAREWVETIYQIRNTNLLKFPNHKDRCRLNTQKDSSCTGDGEWTVWEVNKRMTEWVNYILTEPWYISWTLQTLNILDWINTWEKIFNLCLSWWQRISCAWMENQTRYGKFLRTIEWKWVYLKNSATTWWELTHCLYYQQSWIPVPGGGWRSCDDSERALEFRFCSRVEYIWTKTWSVEICWVLTNFFED